MLAKAVHPHPDRWRILALSIKSPSELFDVGEELTTVQIKCRLCRK
jgi:hypothetical protein